MKNRMFNNVVISILCIFIVLFLVQMIIPNFERVAITEIMPDLKDGKIAFVVDGNINDNINDNTLAPIIRDNQILLPVSLIKTYIDKNIFSNNPYVIIVKNDKYIKIKENDKTYYENYNERNFKTLPLSMDGDIYIPIEEFKNLYDIDFKFIEERNILIMDSGSISKYTAVINKDSVLRKSKSYKSKIVDDVEKDEEIVVYNIDDKWSYAIKGNGSIGYIKNNLYTILKEHVSVQKENVIDDMYDKKVNLLWYQISSKNTNPKVDKLKTIDSLTVVSPTWFEMIRADGTIREKIDPLIVTWAHENGYDVWALMTNPFGNKDLSHSILSNVEAREKVIKELIRLSKENDIDGINVDIESISKETGIYFVQFMRELSVFTHLNKLTLSVDMYMPSNYTEFYNREEIGRLVDYYCLMAYDEHWRTSPKSGSVASLPWVEEGVKKTLEVVPNHKVLLGIPSYTRRWGEKGGSIIQVDALGMVASRKDLEDNDARITYLEDAGQNYGEYLKNGVTYKIWLEDETSLRKRLDIAEKYDLGGVATWKQGFEKDEIWSIYKEYMEK